MTWSKTPKTGFLAMWPILINWLIKGMTSLLRNQWHLEFMSENKTSTVKPALSDHSKRRRKLIFKTQNYLLMQVKGIAECSKGRILQYFRPSLSYHLSLRPLLKTGFTVLFFSCFSVGQEAVL